MVKITVGELKQFIADIPDDVEVRVSSVFNTLTEEYSHVSVCDISYTKEAFDSYLVLDPTEIGVE